MTSSPAVTREVEELLAEIADIAQQLAAAEGVDELLQRIVDLGESYVTGCDGVSMMLVGRKRKVSTPAYSSRIAYHSDLAQYEADEGPCLDALRDHQTYVIDDLETEERWPVYRKRALELGVRSMLSFRLFTHEDTLGALDFYAATPYAYDGYARALGQVFASHASVALKAAMTEAGYAAAISTRDVIGQAKGIIMERHDVTPDAAFARLRELSQHANRPVRDIAADIAATGELPPFDRS